MIFKTPPPAKWKVTGLDSRGKRVNIGRFVSDAHLAQHWEYLSEQYDEVQVVEASKRKAT